MVILIITTQNETINSIKLNEQHSLDTEKKEPLTKYFNKTYIKLTIFYHHKCNKIDYILKMEYIRSSMPISTISSW